MHPQLTSTLTSPEVSGLQGLIEGQIPSTGSDDYKFWDRVDDFNWLRSDPSPNWRFLMQDDPESIDAGLVQHFWAGRASQWSVEEAKEKARIA